MKEFSYTDHKFYLLERIKKYGFSLKKKQDLFAQDNLVIKSVEMEFVLEVRYIDRVGVQCSRDTMSQTVIN